MPCQTPHSRPTTTTELPTPGPESTTPTTRAAPTTTASTVAPTTTSTTTTTAAPVVEEEEEPVEIQVNQGWKIQAKSNAKYYWRKLCRQQAAASFVKLKIKDQISDDPSLATRRHSPHYHDHGKGHRGTRGAGAGQGYGKCSVINCE